MNHTQNLDVSFFNDLALKVKPDMNLANQVRSSARFMGVRFDHLYLLGDDEPLNTAFAGLTAILGETKTREELLRASCVRASLEGEAGHVYYQVFMRPQDDKREVVFIASYGNCLMLLLPNISQWDRSGFSDLAIFLVS
jgi:hypothetical protein